MNKETLEKLCNEYNSEMDHNGSYGHYLADQINKQEKDKELEKRIEFEHYMNFVNAVEKSGINIDDKFAERYEKEKLIRKYTNYTKFNGSGNRKVLLKNCSDYKIGSAFNKIYSSALRKIKRYENENTK